MSDPRPTSRLAAVLIGFLLIASACGDDGGGGETTEATAVPASSESTTTTTPATDSPEGAQGPGATLRADLTGLLQEHVYLVGETAAQALDDGGDVEAVGTQQAMATLDSSSQALSDLIGSFYGLASGERFLGLWQAHIGLLEDYTVALAAGDEEAAAAARQDLDGLGDDLGSFFESVGEGFDGGSVSAAFSPHVDTLTTALDAIAVDDPAATNELRTAAQAMPGIAATVAEAIVEQQRLEGAVDSPGAELRADLTNLLQEHVYLIAVAVARIAEDAGGIDSAASAAALAALDENSVELAEAIGSIYGGNVGDQLLELWRAHTDLLVDYTVAVAGRDSEGTAAAVEGLVENREDLGALLGSNSELLTQEAVAAELQPHVDSLLLAIDAIVVDSPERFELLRQAAQTMPLIALTLAANLQIDL